MEPFKVILTTVLIELGPTSNKCQPCGYVGKIKKHPTPLKKKKPQRDVDHYDLWHPTISEFIDYVNAGIFLKVSTAISCLNSALEHLFYLFLFIV